MIAEATTTNKQEVALDSNLYVASSQQCQVVAYPADVEQGVVTCNWATLLLVTYSNFGTIDEAYTKNFWEISIW